MSKSIKEIICAAFTVIITGAVIVGGGILLGIPVPKEHTIGTLICLDLLIGFIPGMIIYANFIDKDVCECCGNELTYILGSHSADYFCDHPNCKKYKVIV